jgi:hypothetical protein
VVVISKKNMKLMRLISEKQKASSDPEKLALTQMIKANEELGEAAAELLALSKSKNASASAAGNIEGMLEELTDVLSCVIDMLLTQGVTEDKLNSMLLLKLKKWGSKLLPRHHSDLAMHGNLAAWTLWDRSYIEVLSFNKLDKSTSVMPRPLTLGEHNKILLGATPYVYMTSPEKPIALHRKEATDFIETLNYILACNSTDMWQEGFCFCLPTKSDLLQAGILDDDMDKYWLFPPDDNGTETPDTKKMVLVVFGL